MNGRSSAAAIPSWRLRLDLAVTIAAVTAGLRVAPAMTLRWVRRPRPALAPERVTDRDLVCALASLAGVPMLAGSCLTRAIALFIVGRRYGVPSTLVVGVRRRGPAVGAHAWIERGGAPMPAQDVTAFTRLWVVS